MLYKKTTPIGSFAKKGEEIKDGDIITILDEGKKINGEFGTQDIFLVKLVNGEEKNLSFNKTSINNMIDAFGEESKNWIGKDVKVWSIRQNVQGKIIPVYYVSHPDAILTNDGEFVLENGREIVDSDIPIIEE